MKRVPKKNIYPFLSDIKLGNRIADSDSSKNKKRRGEFFLKNRRTSSSAGLEFKYWRKLPKRWRLPRLIVSVSALAIIALVLVGWNELPAIQEKLSGRVMSVWNNFEAGGAALLSFEPEKAEFIFSSNKEAFESVSFIKNLSYVLKRLPGVKDSFSIFEKVLAINNNALAVSRDIGEIKTSGLNLIFSKEGDGALPLLRSLKNNLNEIQEGMTFIRNQLNQSDPAFIDLRSFDQGITDKYLSFNTELYRADQLLAGLIDFLDYYRDRHLLLLFQNPSEMRPSGGFIGSYADLAFRSGKLDSMDVRDIYDPDGQLDLKIVPPKQLQSVTTDWGARDANWFFDFAKSAEKVKSFLEASKIYSEQFIKFNGAIALNVNVIEDLLEIVGPIEITDSDLIITGENFLIEVRKEIEAARDKRVAQPKQILKNLTPILLERLKSLSEDEKRVVFEKLTERLANKDIMFYFEDSRIQNFFSFYGFAGNVYRLPKDFLGNYLAVVNANVAGGKSDAFVEQEINLQTIVGLDGKADNELSVTRTHNGNKQTDPWWRTPNQSFIKVFTIPGTLLTDASGIERKIIPQPIDYEKRGYKHDQDLAAIEDSMRFDPDLNTYRFQEFDRIGFAGWVTVVAGKSKTFKLKYESPLPKIETGDVYQIVIDKQSGVDSKLNLTVQAPIGFKWQENDSSVFVYKNENIPGRLIINLTAIEVL